MNVYGVKPFVDHAPDTLYCIISAGSFGFALIPCAVLLCTGVERNPKRPGNFLPTYPCKMMSIFDIGAQEEHSTQAILEVQEEHSTAASKGAEHSNIMDLD
jgi:hypothetical protein